MKETEIILYDSPQACIKGLAHFDDGSSCAIYKSGSLVTTDEHMARWSGCTHKRCEETGEVYEKTWIDGPTIRARKRREVYNRCPQEERGFPIFVGDDFYGNVDDLVDDYSDREEFDGLTGEIYFGGLIRLSEIRLGAIVTDLPSDCDFDPSPELLNALDALNICIRGEDTNYYEAVNIRPTDNQVREWEKAILQARQNKEL